MSENGNENGNGNGKGHANGGDKEARKTLEERLRLLKFLQPNDSLLFTDKDRREYMHVSKVDNESQTVEGQYIDRYGQIKSRAFSFERIARRNPRVAHYQQITSEQ